jgi:hypothetical protein
MLKYNIIITWRELYKFNNGFCFIIGVYNGSEMSHNHLSVLLPIKWVATLVDKLAKIVHTELLGFLDFFHRSIFYKLENTTFQKLDLLPYSGEKGRHLLSWAPKKELIPVTHSITD